MDEQVLWIFELSINNGERGNLKELMKKMVASTEANEPGTLAYEWSISGDGKQCHTYEMYQDSAAAVAHLKSFKKNYAARLMSLGVATRFVVYGNPDSSVREALEGFGAVYMSPLGGFTRRAETGKPNQG
jgi:quinol monooxygenase YgiN